MFEHSRHNREEGQGAPTQKRRWCDALVPQHVAHGLTSVCDVGKDIGFYERVRRVRQVDRDASTAAHKEPLTLLPLMSTF